MANLRRARLKALEWLKRYLPLEIAEWLENWRAGLATYRLAGGGGGTRRRCYPCAGW